MPHHSVGEVVTMTFSKQQISRGSTNGNELVICPEEGRMSADYTYYHFDKSSLPKNIAGKPIRFTVVSVDDRSDRAQAVAMPAGFNPMMQQQAVMQQPMMMQQQVVMQEPMMMQQAVMQAPVAQMPMMQQAVMQQPMMQQAVPCYQMPSSGPMMSATPYGGFTRLHFHCANIALAGEEGEDDDEDEEEEEEEEEGSDEDEEEEEEEESDE